MLEPPSNRPRGDDLREQVLVTALRLFSEKGYFATSIHDIRQQAGVSTGAIYHHFGNKEAIAQSLYDSLLSRMDDEIAACVRVHSDCLGRCRAIVTLLFELAAREPDTMQFILLAKHRDYLPEHSPICSSGPFMRMRQVLEDGIRDGEVRDMAPWVAATAMFGGALRMMNLHLDGVLERPLADYLDQVVECAWRAVRA